MDQVSSLLHRPIYTYPQVDRLLGLTTNTARRWINGYRHGGCGYKPITRPQTRNITWVIGSQGRRNREAALFPHPPFK